MRTEMKEEPVYAIVIAGGGLKLTPAAVEPKNCGTDLAKNITCHRIGGGSRSGLRADACSIADLAGYISSQTDRLVIDKTRLNGLFQIKTSGWQDFTSEPDELAGRRKRMLGSSLPFRKTFRSCRGAGLSHILRSGSLVWLTAKSQLAMIEYRFAVVAGNVELAKLKLACVMRRDNPAPWHSCTGVSWNVHQAWRGRHARL